MYIYIYIYAHKPIYIYIYIYTEREAERQSLCNCPGITGLSICLARPKYWDGLHGFLKMSYRWMFPKSWGYPKSPKFEQILVLNHGDLGILHFRKHRDVPTTLH